MRIHNQLKSISKYFPLIEKESKKFGIENKMLLGIAILEDINRPRWIRIFEKVMCKFIPIRTFGLMQMKSTVYLDDQTSIKLAAKFISNLNYDNDPIKLGEQYNGSREYGVCLAYILSELEESYVENGYR
jgi:hypothetical protein